MTPAKVLALMDAHMRDLGQRELPLVQLAWLYSNANRDHGEKDEKGNVIRPPAPVIAFDEFRTVRRLAKSLAAKDSVPSDYGGPHNWLGANAIKEQFTGTGPREVKLQ